MKIAILGSDYQQEMPIRKLFGSLSKHQAEVCIQKDFFDYLQSEFKLDYPHCEVFGGDDFSADFAFSIGGDGTLLRTAAIVGKKNIPILGINTGTLGFLADINEKNIEEMLNNLFEGKYRIEHRSQIQVSTDFNTLNDTGVALNEVALLKQDTASMITINAYINDEYLTSYQADGLIISTPTGSTAYSLSIGGPIMTPKAANFIIAAIAPHSLNTRPLVIEDSCVIRLEIEGRNRNYLISVDGRSSVLPIETKLTIKKAQTEVKLVKGLDHTFYGTIRDKLMWGADPRTTGQKER
ncbi:NAD+ kinase [Dysgonomonas sp. PH5-45]|uniref:NAD kinase n=1 Tax=unclassified Dysgonomonas TaxID=2630389 RepID=UPI002474F289|nr:MULTISPECIES: NAD kinase [unclassified Dysgonomonas]MDH6354778.1 NAD+ kinase [Dysgonomonas sp. PH5-45]MDH6387677.1 NAD+ kinase [Dysgonomonas sp. PH5-37]